MSRLIACIGCFALCATLAAAGGTAKGGKLEGTWVAISAVSDGKKLPDEFIQKAMLTVAMKKGKYSVTIGGKEVEAGTYTTDASKKPATIDMDITEGKDKGKKQLGLYKVEGDMLTIALGQHDKGRPKDFNVGATGELTVLKRSK